MDVLRLAWPLILSNSFWMLQINIDRVILGRYSADAVAASMAAALLFWTPLTVLQITAGFTSTFVAQYTGAGRPERIGPAVWQGLYFALVGGLLFLLVLPLAGPIITGAGHAAHLQELELTYFRCLCFSALPTLINAAASGFFIGRGQSRTILLINAIGLAVNVPLAYAWVLGRWGLPELGIAGAGWATVSGTSTAAVVSLLLLFRPCNRAFGVWSWALERPLFGRLLSFGLPGGMQAGLDAAAWTVFIFIIGRLGPAELTATTIAFTLNLLVYMPTLGIAQAVGVLVGQHLGEGCPDRAARACRSGVWPALLLTAAISLAYLFAPAALAGLFRGEERTAEWTRVAALVPVLLRFVVLYCLFDTLNLVYSFALRGAGDTRFVTAVAVALAWPVLVAPSWAVARWPGENSLYLAWSFASLYIMLLALVFWLRFRHGKWRSMRVIEAKP